jgi:hypothetical protein
MPDDIKKVLYGLTKKVTLADGKDYTLREPSLASLDGADINLTEVNSVENVKKLAYLMLKEDNPGLDETKVAGLITFSMLRDGSPFMKALLGVLGLGDEKNE